MYDLICLSMHWQQRRVFFCKEHIQEVVDIARLSTISRDLGWYPDAQVKVENNDHNN